MKKLLLVLAVAAIFSSCTENERAKHFGGTQKIMIPKGDKLVEATWKANALWILTAPMEEGDKARTLKFHEKSSFGVMEGTVIFQETK